MKPVPRIVTAAVLTAFGLLTVFLSGSVILDLFDIRVREGNYVLFIVWANLISGVLFLTAAVGLLMKKGWAASPLIISLIILVIAFAGLLLHINSGGAYETKTVGAMIFRMTVNSVLALVVYSATKKQKRSTLVRAGILMLLPLSLLTMRCNQVSEKNHGHHGMEAEDAHDHEGHTGALSLNNGEKWVADDHTFSVVERMKSGVLEFDRASEKDYSVLSDSLTNQLNVLIAGCTMKGPAHDELHKWLVPVTENVKALSATDDAGRNASTVKVIKASLDSFDVFFQPDIN